jgi:hypothetical protein
MIILPEETYPRVVVDGDNWVVIQQLTPTVAICVREIDINGGADKVNLVVLEL